MITTNQLTHEESMAQIEAIDSSETKEIVLALIKHRLRISHMTYYRKVDSGFDPEALQTIHGILSRWTGDNAPQLD